MRHKSAMIFCAIAAMGAFCSDPSAAQSGRIVLITADEAKRPQPPTGGMALRGITRGPAIEVLSPHPPDISVASPIHLQLKFEVHGGAQIDEASFKLTDISEPAVDLTDRVKNFAKPTGVDVPEAEVPPGTYTIRAEVRDKDGRTGVLVFTLNVAKP